VHTKLQFQKSEYNTKIDRTVTNCENVY